MVSELGSSFFNNIKLQFIIFWGIVFDIYISLFNSDEIYNQGIISILESIKLYQIGYLILFITILKVFSSPLSLIASIPVFILNTIIVGRKREKFWKSFKDDAYVYYMPDSQIVPEHLQDRIFYAIAVYNALFWYLIVNIFAMTFWKKSIHNLFQFMFSNTEIASFSAVFTLTGVTFYFGMNLLSNICSVHIANADNKIEELKSELNAPESEMKLMQTKIQLDQLNMMIATEKRARLSDQIRRRARRP